MLIRFIFVLTLIVSISSNIYDPGDDQYEDYKSELYLLKKEVKINY